MGCGPAAGAMYSVNLVEGKLDFEHLGPELPDWPGNGVESVKQANTVLPGTTSTWAKTKNGIQYFSLEPSKTQHSHASIRCTAFIK